MPRALTARIRDHLSRLYPQSDLARLTDTALAAFFPKGDAPRRRARQPSNGLWTERDIVAITYGNSFIDGAHVPLDLLHDFLLTHLRGAINTVHILPFFPYTSDDGFAVTDYRTVNSWLGDWTHIGRIAGDFRLMADLVLNHVSSQGEWFSRYRQNLEPHNRFFFEADPEDDLSSVVRPRPHPLLRAVETAQGLRHVWCTFSHDQVDLDFSNPEVLFEFLSIMRFHIAQGVRTIRLDAVAYVWKKIGTDCIHRPETHEIVRLMRTLADWAEERIVLITETNVPNRENLSYFGNRNEAHAVYNFSLPPLMLHALLAGTSEHLNAWQMSMPPAQLGCAYLNFTASHDGIGVRPAEGLLGEDELQRVIGAVERFGGKVSMRAMPDGGVRPYELNIALFDALKGTFAGEDGHQIERFICSQTIMLALEGIPAFYIHSLLATPNDHERVAQTGHNRSINRHQWHYPALRAALADPSTPQAQVFGELRRRIGVRIGQKAFHPNATQFTLQLGHALFGVWRQSLDRDQSIFAIANMTPDPITLSPFSLNLIEGDQWTDLLSGEQIAPRGSDIAMAPYQCRWISNRAPNPY